MARNLRARIERIVSETPEIKLYEFRAGASLPPFSAGSHIDLHLPNGLVRSYSLANAQEEEWRYLIGVKVESGGRGGSRYIHEHLKVGDGIEITPPRNNFRLEENASHTILFAGGIGITPIFSMVQRLEKLGRSWELHYGARSPDSAAFANDLTRYGEKVKFHFDSEAPEPATPGMDIAGLVARADAQAHLYCCGPSAMLQLFETATASRAPGHVHLERFSSDQPVATDGSFIVQLAQSGKSVKIEPGQTILNTLLEEGYDLEFSCTEGICGACETQVLDGIPLHQDMVLTKEQHDKNDRMMICCSRSLTNIIILDL